MQSDFSLHDGSFSASSFHCSCWSLLVVGPYHGSFMLFYEFFDILIVRLLVRACVDKLMQCHNLWPNMFFVDIIWLFRKDLAMIVVYMLVVLKSCLIWLTQIQLLLLSSISLLRFLSYTMNRFCIVHGIFFFNIFFGRRQEEGGVFRQ